jgi:hypothetical protein
MRMIVLMRIEGVIWIIWYSMAWFWFYISVGVGFDTHTSILLSARNWIGKRLDLESYFLVIFSICMKSMTRL